MSNTSNFDYCVQLGFAAVEEIYHLALKNEDIFPHNLPPRNIDLGGTPATVLVSAMDDDDRPADLEFTGEKEVTFSLPIDIAVEIPEAPDPSLSRITLRARVNVPGALATWQQDSADQLGIDFGAITPADVTVAELTGLPELSNDRFRAAVHAAYDDLPTHTFSSGGNTVVIYNGNADPDLTPGPKASLSQIETAIEAHGGTQFLRISIPIHATVTSPIAFSQYGTATFWREITAAPGSVSVAAGTTPPDPTPNGVNEIATTVVFDGGLGATQIAAALAPLINNTLTGFGTITEPWFTQSEAEALLAEEAANYLRPLRLPVYTPLSGDETVSLSEPIGFILVAPSTLAILMNRRTGTAADDTAPDNFRGDTQLSLAVGAAKLQEVLQESIDEEFPGVNNGGERISTDEGDATLQSLSVTASDPGAHGVSEGHLWFSGAAEVHINCWPDPDITFSGPMFLRLDVTETETECSGEFRVEMGEFDAGQSCCDVFIDIIIPVVGWIMLGVIEGMIDSVGGELAAEIAGEQARSMEPIPAVVLGVAEIQSCLLSVSVSSQGLVLPGKLRIRRDGTSFEDLEESRSLPRP